MKEKKEVRTIRQKLASFVTASLTGSLAALIGGLGIVAIVFLPMNSRIPKRMQLNRKFQFGMRSAWQSCVQYVIR